MKQERKMKPRKGRERQQTVSILRLREGDLLKTDQLPGNPSQHWYAILRKHSRSPNPSADYSLCLSRLQTLLPPPPTLALPLSESPDISTTYIPTPGAHGFQKNGPERLQSASIRSKRNLGNLPSWSSFAEARKHLVKFVCWRKARFSSLHSLSALPSQAKDLVRQVQETRD
jgi:hypothetical protein